ncbi:MAG: PAS domain-containing protein [Lachnospiraceae bacterium]|nr:PAS domain-containing protein [Lachnospiraceae bacterium]
MEHYKKLVEFLGQVLGEHTEVVLRDCRKPNHDIVAIANGHVSGRTVGAPITDFTLSILANEEWKEKDYVANYVGKAAPNKKLRSSTYFIREHGKLVGELCINIDLSPFEQLMDSVRALSGMNEMRGLDVAGAICDEPVENFSDDVIGDMMSRAVVQVVGSCDAIVRERLTQKDRIRIIRELNRAGLFQIKGAVGAVAEYLYCSEASVYRYQSKIQKEQ